MNCVLIDKDNDEFDFSSHLESKNLKNNEIFDERAVRTCALSCTLLS